MRNCFRPVRAILETGISLPRSLLIAQLGKPMYWALDAVGLAGNACFFGVNNFRVDEDYGRIMRRWLQGAANCADTPLIMCHPGIRLDPNSQVHDPIAARRFDEFTYLSSSTFADDLDAHGLSLART